MEVRTTGVPVIGEKELRRAAEILRRYKQAFSLYSSLFQKVHVG